MRIKFYMKSSNVITQRGIKDVAVRCNAAGAIEYIKIDRYWYAKFIPNNHLFVASLQLGQIEAITR